MSEVQSALDGIERRVRWLVAGHLGELSGDELESLWQLADDIQEAIDNEFVAREPEGEECRANFA